VKPKIIEINFNGSLYDPASEPLVARIEDAIGEAGFNEIVVMRASESCHDYHKTWLEQLSGKVYWEDLAAHFQRVHIALIGICISKAKWYFVSGSDCLGSWWDLALACHGRIWASPYAKVGYPEVYIDLIPPLSSGGLRKFASYQSPEASRKNAIMFAKDAYANGLISLVLQGQGWAEESSMEVLASWIQKVPYVSNLRATTKRDLIEASPDLLGVIESRANLQTRRKQISASHLDFGASILKEKNLAARAQAMALVRAGGAARLLFEDYRAWLSRRIARYEMGVRDRWWSSKDGLLVVDLKVGMPPASILKAILSRKIHIIFMAPDEHFLKEALETIINRLQRGGFSRKEVLAMWRGRVEWVVGDASKTSRMWLRCPPTDKLELGVGTQKVVSAYRLSGNFGQSTLGWVEILEEAEIDGAQDDEQIATVKEFLNIISNGTLSLPASPVQIPLGALVRFVLLAEMIRLADLGTWPDLIEQCKLLSTIGWGFASDAPQWDALLRGYGKLPQLPEYLSHFSVKNTDWLQWSSVSEIRSKTLKNSSVARLEVSAARLSRYYEAFSIKVSNHLVEKKMIQNQTASDLLVTLAWGYPGAAPLPMDLNQQIGSIRADEWLKQ
jgi:hypothetical protein